MPDSVAARALGVGFPLVQAGMGGIATPALAAAVSDAGALGTVALYKMDGEQSRAAVSETANRTEFPFGVNVIPEVAGETLLRVQVEAVLAAAADNRQLVFNCYGLPPRWLVTALQGSVYTLLVQVGTPDDAERAVELGARVLVAQGIEAGGHLLGALGVRELVAATLGRGLPVPVLAAGGLGDGRQLVELAGLGAAGWLCGTAFVATVESGAHHRYKQALVTADREDTVISDRFEIGWPGRRHRVLRSVVTDSPDPLPASFIAWTTVAGACRPVPRGAAAAPTVESDGQVDEMARYAGTGCGAVAGVLPAAEVVTTLRKDYRLATGGFEMAAAAKGRR